MTDGCVTCHAVLGYKDGDLRGGVSVSIPLTPYFNAAKKVKESIFLTHFIIWFIASIILILFIRFVRDLLFKMKEKEQQLIFARVEAEKSELAKGQFLATMSHEIRTPMNGVLWVNQLLSETELTDEQKDYVNTMSHSGQTLLSIINDILDFSKIAAGEMRLHNKPFSLQKTVNRTMKLLEETAKQKQIEFVFISEANSVDYIYGDEFRLQQVLLNLLGNAIKFTKQGTVSLTTKIVKLSDERVNLLFEIKDTGIGIKSKGIKKLFTPFTQANTSTTLNFGGTGLGLAISNRIVNLMGGDISVSSVLGSGSTFSFELLFKVVAEVETKQIKKESVKKETLCGKNDKQRNTDPKVTKATDKPSILLVEDNRVNQKIATKMLEPIDALVTCALNGKEAVEIFRKNHFDLILMDCQMPIMDGFEATKLIRELEVNSSRIPIIAVTANAMEGDRENCILAGMDDFLMKPIDKDALVSTVNIWLNKNK
jgi:signal transduction histidine kinase/ActR/RegA family two-component response regulator